MAPIPSGNPTALSSPPLFSIPEATAAGNTLVGAEPSFRSPGKGGLRAERALDAAISMPTASALEAKQPLTVSEVAVAASSTSAADASAIALSADFAIVVVDSHHDEQGLTADAAQSNSPADEIATMTGGVVRVSQIIDRF